MEEQEDALPPFWLQSGSADGRRLRRSYSMFLSSGAVLIFLLVVALAFIFIITPTLHSFTSHILKPHAVKKSWDSLNLILVLFAILCGFLSRNNTNETPRSSYQDQTFIEATQEYAKPNPETPMHWYEYSDRTPSYNRLRSFNSYPDLRQESWIAAEERWRFYDDTHVNGYRGVDMDDTEHRQLRRRRSRPDAGEEERGIVKNIEVDTFEVRKKEVPGAPPIPVAVQPSPPPPPPPPPLLSKDRPRNARMDKDLGGENSKQRRSTPPRLPSPPPLLPAVRNKNKRGSSTKEFLASMKGKKKKQRQRSVENFESILNSQPPRTVPSQPPPPPPPPPPSVFHNLFSSKKSKHKKGHSDYPPPPRVSSSKTKPHVVAKENVRPRPRENFYSLEDNVITGNESPLIPIPPPPPPPPFNLPAWKFRVQGDYVRIDSISSSSSGSPDLDEAVDSPIGEASQCNSPFAPHGGGEPEILLFYPSPDVDTKADTFIETFRAGLRMEKMNSTMEKQGIGRSNLGPSPYSEKTRAKLKLQN